MIDQFLDGTVHKFKGKLVGLQFEMCIRDRHKGYRMQELDPILKENQVEVSKLVVGLLSGRGKDLMTIQGRTVDSAYFIPNLKSWFVESSLYPFIGGDGVKREHETESSLQASINLILPYGAPDVYKRQVFDVFGDWLDV